MNNKIKAVMSVIVITALLLTGTFAWVNFTQHMKNEFEGGPGDPPGGGTGHDDFDDPKKDVYIENWGKNNLYVRIRLDEYMEIGDGAGKKGTFENGVWIPNPSNNATSLISTANIDDERTWSPHIPVNGEVEICDPPADFHYYWEWEMGGWKYYMPAPEDKRTDPGYMDQNTEIYDGSEDGVAKTLDAVVITMQQWHNLGKPIGEYWVIDTDGWAYWAAPLKPGEATGLILSAVSKIADPEQSYYYAINVIVQMATKFGELNYKDYYSDPGDPDHSATDDGKELLDLITKDDAKPGKPKIPATGIKINGGDKTMTVGENGQLTYTITPSDSTDTVLWSSSDSSIVTIDNNGKITAVGAGTATVKVMANGHSDTITIDVTAASLPSIPTKPPTSPNGEDYDTKTSDTLSLNYALICKNNKGDIERYDQDGSIKLSDIIDGISGISVSAAEAEYDGYITVGTDKDGDPAVIYSYIPDINTWIAAIPGTPVIEHVELILKKDGFQNTPVKVTLRYHGSMFRNE